MAKFKVKHKNDQLFVRVKLSRSDAVSDAELESFARAYIRGFLKPKKLRRDLIEYSGPIGISLYERMRLPVTRYEFFFIMEQIVDSYQRLWKCGLLPGRVIWDIHHVYYNEPTKELLFIYIPFTTVQSSENVRTLMDAVGYSAIPQREPNADYVSRFMFFLNSLTAFDAAAIEKFIEHEDKKVVSTIKKHGCGQSGFMTDKPKDYYEHYDKKAYSADDGSDPTALLDDDEGTGLLEEGTGLLNRDEGTGLLDDEEGTALLAENQADIHYPSLLRVITKETVVINKPVFRLGKEKNCVDYIVTDNNTVSRSHADIITRCKRYFVMDLDSKNSTFINDKAIPVRQEVEIFDGDHIKLSNEEFVFNA